MSHLPWIETKIIKAASPGPHQGSRTAPFLRGLGWEPRLRGERLVPGARNLIQLSHSPALWSEATLKYQAAPISTTAA